MKNEFDFNDDVRIVHDNFISSHCVISSNGRLGLLTLKPVYKKMKEFKLTNEYSYYDWLLSSKKYKNTNYNYFYLVAIVVSSKLFKLCYYALWRVKHQKYFFRWR